MNTGPSQSLGSLHSFPISPLSPFARYWNFESPLERIGDTGIWQPEITNLMRSRSTRSDRKAPAGKHFLIVSRLQRAVTGRQRDRVPGTASQGRMEWCPCGTNRLKCSRGHSSQARRLGICKPNTPILMRGLQLTSPVYSLKFQLYLGKGPRCWSMQ